MGSAAFYTATTGLPVAADLASVTPNSGFPNGQQPGHGPIAASADRRSSKLAAGQNAAHSSDQQSKPAQPALPLQSVKSGSPAALLLQQQQMEEPKWLHNSEAVRLANNPISSLARLHEGLAAVLDDPVSNYRQSMAGNLYGLPCAWLC